MILCTFVDIFIQYENVHIEIFNSINAELTGGGASLLPAGLAGS
jgi:hypothetical protein